MSEKIGRVCSIHQEYCPDGNCRWCVPPAAPPDDHGVLVNAEWPGRMTAEEIMERFKRAMMRQQP